MKTKKVKFWSRILRGRSEEWVLMEGEDASGIPFTAWKTLNGEFWAWKLAGKLQPVDEHDAYQMVVGEMLKAMERLRKEGASRLHSASLSTYLVATAFKGLLKYKERVVDRTRELYRARIEQGVSAIDVKALVEARASGPDVFTRERARLAREARQIWTMNRVRETIARLTPDAQAGLGAWLAANGVWTDAARRYNLAGSVQGYIYRFKAIWAPAFRRAWKEACDAR